MCPAASSRWCPTPEQLMILEEIYTGGLRTPTASQIQHITAYLSSFGKIEGKNVFYWFQNHKARDRQKLRRLCGQLLQQQHHINYQLLHYLEPPAASPGFLPQGAVLDQNASKQMMSYTWKADRPESCEMNKSMTSTYGRDWVMMTDVGPTTHFCNRPLKTLELFPIAATSLKEECTTSKQISCSTSTNNLST